MRRLFVLFAATALLLASVPATMALSHQSLTVSVVKAPVTPDGTTAGSVTDFVLTFVDIDPAVDGISMKKGGSISARLPAGFVNTADGTENTAIILQGWPQSPPFPFIWDTTVVGNRVTATLTADYLVGAFGPGPKQFHLLLESFRNPGPGLYEVGLVVRPDPASNVRSNGTGTVLISPRATPSVEIVSVFSGGGPPPPFNNPLFQTVSAGDDSLDVGVYFWERGSFVADGIVNPFLDVDIEMNNLERGRLTQFGHTVGHIEIEAPAGADEFAVTNDGPSFLGSTAVTGLDVGVMVARLSTDPDATGDYTITFVMNGGNTKEFHVTAE